MRISTARGRESRGSSGRGRNGKDAADMGCNVSKDVKVEDQGNNAENGNNGDGMSEEKAAEKIQASFRGYKTRKSLKNNGVLPPPKGAEEKKANGGIETKVKELTDQPSEENATKPNSATATDLDEILDIDLTDKDLEKAAAKIQASYRNFTKKKIANTAVAATEPEEAQNPGVKKEEEKVDEDNLEDIDLGDPEVEKAALKIQSTFRGYKIRKEINTDEEKPIQNGEKAEDEE